MNIFTINDDASGTSGLRQYIRTRHLKCFDGPLCDEIMLLHIGFLPYSKIRVEVSFPDIDSIALDISDVTFEVKVLNPDFTRFEIWFRFSLLIVTFLVTSLFAHSLRKTQLNDWTIEQKWTSMLLCLLLFYNDPVFPITFIVTSWIPGLADSVLQASFLSALLLFWLCIHHGLFSVDRSFWMFYFPKLVICSVL